MYQGHADIKYFEIFEQSIVFFRKCCLNWKISATYMLFEISLISVSREALTGSHAIMKLLRIYLLQALHLGKVLSALISSRCERSWRRALNPLPPQDRVKWELK